MVLNGLELNDMILSASQQLLHQQFPSIKGLRSILSPITNLGAWVNNYLQIFHCHTNHWTTASTMKEKFVFTIHYTPLLMTSQRKALPMFLPCQPSSTQYLLFKNKKVQQIAVCLP